MGDVPKEARKDTYRSNMDCFNRLFLYSKSNVLIRGRPQIIKVTAINDNWKEMEKRAEESINRIKLPAMERLERTSFSFSEMNEKRRTIAMMNARWVEGENPENMQYNSKGIIVMIPACDEIFWGNR